MINKKTTGLYIMSAIYIIAGINHFIMTNFYMKIMPDYIPYHLSMVYISGIAEIFLGVLLLFDKYRTIAAFGIILLLIAVFPANVYQYTSGQIPLNIFIIRALIQPLLIFWSYKYMNNKKAIS